MKALTVGKPVIGTYKCSREVSLSHSLGSYPGQPTISQAKPSSAGILRPRGAPICCIRYSSL